MYNMQFNSIKKNFEHNKSTEDNSLIFNPSKTTYSNNRNNKSNFLTSEEILNSITMTNFHGIKVIKNINETLNKLIKIRHQINDINESMSKKKY